MTTTTTKRVGSNPSNNQTKRVSENPAYLATKIMAFLEGLAFEGDEQAGVLLLEGDMTDGDDKLLIEGDFRTMRINHTKRVSEAVA